MLRRLLVQQVSGVETADKPFTHHQKDHILFKFHDLLPTRAAAGERRRASDWATAGDRRQRQWTPGDGGGERSATRSTERAGGGGRE